jgi:CBS domain-containing protein
MSYLVKQYMRKDVPTIDGGSSATDAAKAMTKAGRGFLIVLRNDQLAGIVTRDDLVSKIIAEEKDPARITVAQIMSSPLITVDPDQNLVEAAEIMHKNNIRRLPVVKDGILYGMITAMDVAQHCGEYADRAVRDILRWTPLFGP